jgi:hypothetical protein
MDGHVLIEATVTQLNAMLQYYSALIVHFSGQPRGSGAVAHFPHDLEYAMANAGSCRLACSTVRPRDSFDPGTLRNATGSVGLVLAPRTNASLLDVWHTDAGSSRGRIVREVTLNECEQTIVNRVGYNEWAIMDFDVLGLFAVDPLQVDGLQQVPDGYGGTIISSVPVDVDLTNLPTSLASLPIYTFSSGFIAQRVKHQKLYP